MTTENNNNITGTEEENQEIKKIIGFYIDHWYWALVSLFICGLTALLYLRYATPMYNINATVLVEDPQKGGGGIFGQATGVMQDFGDLFNTKSSVDNEAQILQTKDLMAEVVKDMQLYAAYYNKGSVNETEIYHRSPLKISVLSSPDSLGNTKLELDNIRDNKARIHEIAKDFDSSYEVSLNTPFSCQAGQVLLQNTGKIPEKNKKLVIYLKPVRQVAEQLQKAITVTIPNKQVTTINLQLKYPLQDKGNDILDTLIHDYITSNIDNKNAFADSTIQFINGRLLVVNQELADIEKGVEVFKTANHIADIDAQSQQVIANAADFMKQENLVEVQEQVTQSMLQYLQDERNNLRPVPSLLNNPDPTFLVLLDKYNTLLSQRDRLALGSTDENPLVQNLDGQIGQARKDLVASLQNQLAAIRVGKQKIKAQNTQMNAYINSVPAKERQFIDLSRQQEIKQALFVFLLQKKEEVAVTKASNIASARLIDRPSAESSPYSPKKNIILLGGLLAGLLLPYGFFMVREMLNNRVSSLADLKQLVRKPIVGEITHNNEKIHLVYAEKSRSVIAEQFRALRSNLQFTMGQKECATILFTSSMSGEGKSFLATNLALAYTSIGKKVLLMEMDLRKPKLAAYLGITRQNGFTNYLVSDLAIHDIIHTTAVDAKLDILMAGSIPPNPAELLNHPKMDSLVRELKKKYDIIIMDAAPIGMVSDAQTLAPFADTVLYVVRQNYTYKQQIGIVNELLDSGKIPHLYLLMNDVKMKTSGRYGYGYGYGYGTYGYGTYGYGETNEKSSGKKVAAIFFQGKQNSV